MPLNNFGCVVPHLIYRGGQPDEEGIQTLFELGVGNILKLNTEQVAQEIEWCGAVGIELVQEPIPTFVNKTETIRNLADLLKTLQGMTYVHCEHGRDRTGLVVGAYRLLYQNWSLDQVQEERKEYGVEGLIKFADGDMDLILGQLAGAKK